MPTLSPAQVAALVKQAGFPEDVQVTMVAIAGAESGYRVEAKNPRSSASGLFQILWSVHRQYDQNKLLSDAAYNTKAAYDIWKSQGLKAWVVYTSGAYKNHLAEARQGVASAASVTGTPVVTPGGSTTTGQPAVTYGALGFQIVTAGVGTPLAAEEETWEPLTGLRIIGSTAQGDFASAIIGEPAFEAGLDMVPHLRFTIIDPYGSLFTQQAPLIKQGARVQYRDLNLRIDTITFAPGSHGTGQIDITAVDATVYALMNLTGPRTEGGQSATDWLFRELGLAGLNAAATLLGQAVPTQSTISRDVPDQTGSSGQTQHPSAWTTGLRLARELGKRLFISGNRLVFGSSAFAMQWCAPGPLVVDGAASEVSGLRPLELPTVSQTSVGNSSTVRQVTFKVALNRAKFFRPGVPVQFKNVIGVAGAAGETYLVSHMQHTLGVDVSGAEIVAMQPVDPPPQPPTAPANPNGGAPGSGASVSGGGADGQVDRFVALALQETGKTYRFGAEASPSDPNPSAFDCSELVEWAAGRAGITPKVPDGSSAQQAWCRSHGTLIPISQGINTKGALLFMSGHVAISLGNGKTVEAMNPSQGVRQGNANGRNWSSAGKIPGAQGYR